MTPLTLFNKCCPLIETACYELVNNSVNRRGGWLVENKQPIS